MKIAVLCGGLSTERKISLSSGTRVCAALRSCGHQAVLIDLFLGIENMDDRYRKEPERLFEEMPPLEDVVFDGKEPDLQAVKASRKYPGDSLFGEGVLEVCRKADVVFIALHGLNGEDGRVQAAFDLLAIPYTGSGYLGAAMTMDKMITKQMLQPLGVPTPAWHYYKDVQEQDIPEIVDFTEVPCVVKTPTGGSSVGVEIVHGKEELLPAIRNCLTYGSDLLIEEYVKGREFTCAVLQDRALPSVEIAPKVRFYDYSNKYQAGATEEICPGRCSAEVEQKMHDIALFVHRTMRLSTYSRSDFIVDDNDNVYFLEVNTLPGMTPTSLVPQEAAQVGISYPELCEIIIQDALSIRGRKG